MLRFLTRNRSVHVAIGELGLSIPLIRARE